MEIPGESGIWGCAFKWNTKSHIRLVRRKYDVFATTKLIISTKPFVPETRIGGWKLSGSPILCAVIFDLARYLTAVKNISTCNTYGAHCTIWRKFLFPIFFQDVISKCQAFSQIGAGNFGCSQNPILIKVVEEYALYAIFIHNPWQSNLIPRGPKGCIVSKRNARWEDPTCSATIKH